MYAIVETGGKQYRVTEGDVIAVEKLGAEAGEKVELDKVLVLGEGADIKVGTPYIDGAKVIGEVVENGKSEKIIVFKYKAKKDYRKKQGHRQPYTTIRIESLGGNSAKKAEKPAKAEGKGETDAKAKKTAPEEKKISTSMKKDELIAYAEERGIKVDAKSTKAEIIEAIEAANK